jgi:glutathione-regulated potassium-efflux system ancillary protein KefG
MNRILILFAHPALEKSRAHKALLKNVEKLEGVTINDLYENYPEFDIDIKREQKLLMEHDIIIWQHPLYWYSGPALLKQWMDLVLEHDWAYGKHGRALEGKRILNAFSSGGGKDAYAASGMQHCTISQVMMQFQRTAELCKMIYLPPFWVPGTHRMDVTQINEYGRLYRKLVIALREDYYTTKQIQPVECLNDLLTNN